MNTTDLKGLYLDHHAKLCQRTSAVLEQTGHQSLILYSGAPEYFFLDDNHVPFKPNPHFKTWVPVEDAPESFIVFSPGEKPRLVLYKPVDYWFKITPFQEDFWTASFEIQLVESVEAGYRLLPKKPNMALIGPNAEELAARLEADLNPAAVIHRLDYARARKTDYELSCMREAAQRAVDGHVAAEQAFREGASEFDIHLAYLRASQQTEADLPYGNIIALNENAAVLHYHNMSPMRPAAVHSFLIDAGATFNGYASDITRTYSALDDEFQELVDAMDTEQQAMCEEVKPGLDYKELHLGAHRRIAKLLSEFEFVNLSAEEIYETGISRAFFPHGLGHFLGLQVHDVGGLQAEPTGGEIPRPDGHPFLRLTRTLHAGYVTTIEPGLYFIDPLLDELRAGDNASHVNWKKVDAFKRFGGVRVEDDVAVTETGHENLTRPLFANVD